ncbi:MAG: hypothetical protein ACEQSX_04275 [Baekduiaceae bacterium]
MTSKERRERRIAEAVATIERIEREERAAAEAAALGRLTEAERLAAERSGMTPARYEALRGVRNADDMARVEDMFPGGRDVVDWDAVAKLRENGGQS